MALAELQNNLIETHPIFFTQHCQCNLGHQQLVDSGVSKQTSKSMMKCFSHSALELGC